MLRLLLVVLWLTCIHGALLPGNLDDPLQRPLGEADENLCYKKTKVVETIEDLPVVDLGYAKHKAVTNPNKKLYHFQSIRYAAPPVGSLRFKAPQPPLKAPANQVEDGSGRKECLQATIKWAETFPDDDNLDDPDCCREDDDDGTCKVPCKDKDPKPKFNWRKLLGGLVPQNLTDPKYYGEDCLHLDVWAPTDFWNKSKDGDDYIPKAVIVWIYGGAYVFGGKSLYFPGGLIDRSETFFSEGTVFVSMNYRMGALGFAAGREIADEDVNAGLLDQRQALKWVKEHIAKFGGDPNLVTVAGLSAGGGSVIHHLTAYGGEGESLFRRAISLSGGWQPIVNKTRADNTFQDFMKTYNKVKSIEELRQVSPEQMMKANYEQILKSPPGTFTYNPVGWGNFAPKSPAKLLYDGKYHRDVNVMLSHAADEGSKFATAFADKKTSVLEFLDLALPDLDADEREFLNETYSDGKTAADNIGNIIGDATFRCPVTYVSDAMYGNVYRQRWNTYLSNGHGGDLLYLFYQPGIPVTSLRAARMLQDYVLTFANLGFPATIIANPTGFKDPVPYVRSTDGKEQHIDSYKPIPFPKVTRDTDKLEYICRTWQTLSAT